MDLRLTSLNLDESEYGGSPISFNSPTSSSSRQSQLLLVSLLENFCTLYERSPTRSKRLFYTLCVTLNKMGMIASTDFIEEMSSVRASYKKAFTQLVASALESFKDDRLLMNRGSSSTSLESLSKRPPLEFNSLLETSRLSEDFIILEKLGRGGFGTVTRVTNRLDGTDYAIKRIPLSLIDQEIETILSEVKVHARIHHPHIVSYFASWLECSTTVLSSDDEDSTSNSMNSSSPEEREWSLYIQMELCQSTLQDYLTTSKECIHQKGMRVFTDILKGLDHIHTLNLVHRDIKPSNIFWKQDSNTWKIGDFGLTTLSDLVQNSELPISTNGVGTFTYASPEQSKGTNHTCASDIYSLGIILFELLHPFNSHMERAKLFESLKSGNVPESFVESYPKETALILWMTSNDPLDRPSASQLLDLDLLSFCMDRDSQVRDSQVTLESTSETCSREVQLENELEQVKNELKKVKALNAELQSRINQLLS